jgi:undecaprenyl-diphosphatase
VSILLALFLGIVQGLAEFLPISSSGHLILFQHIFKLPEDMLLFDIILHVATLVAVVIVFHKKIWQLVRHPFNKTNLYLIITTVITCTLVLVFKDWIDKAFNYRILPFTFMITAMILWSTSLCRGGRESHREKIGGAAAVVGGVAQGLAVVPGLSRSGTTISALLHTGVERKEAAE